EQVFDGLGDGGLRGVERHAEHDLVRLRELGRFFGDHRRKNDVVIAHAALPGSRRWAPRRSSIAFTAFFVRTSFSRRMMSYTLRPAAGSSATLDRLRALSAKLFSNSPST